MNTFVDRYCSTVQGVLDWFEVDLGFTELLVIQIDSTNVSLDAISVCFDLFDYGVATISRPPYNYKSFLQNIVYFIGLFCKRDL